MLTAFVVYTQQILLKHIFNKIKLYCVEFFLSKNNNGNNNWPVLLFILFWRLMHSFVATNVQKFVNSFCEHI